MFTQEPMVYGLFRVSSLKEIVTLPIKKIGRALKFYFFFFFFFFVLCFVFFLLVNFYSLGQGEDIINPKSEFGIISPVQYFLFILVTRAEVP